MDLKLNFLQRVFIGYSVGSFVLLGVLILYYGITGNQFDNSLYLPTIPGIIFTIALLIKIMWLDLKE